MRGRQRSGDGARPRELTPRRGAGEAEIRDAHDANGRTTSVRNYVGAGSAPSARGRQLRNPRKRENSDPAPVCSRLEKQIDACPSTFFFLLLFYVVYD